MTQLPHSILSSLAVPPVAEDDSIFDPILPGMPEVVPYGLYLGLLALLVITIAAWLGLRWLVKRPQWRNQAKLETLTANGLRELQTSLEAIPGNELGLAATDLLKRYLSETYHDQLRYETPSEFLRRLTREGTKVPSDIREPLVQFLLVSEEIKFGNLATGNERKKELLSQAMRIAELVRLDQDRRKPQKR